MAASICTPAGADVCLGAQQGGQGVEGQAEESEGAQEQTGAIHYPNSGGRFGLTLHLEKKMAVGERKQKTVVNMAMSFLFVFLSIRNIANEQGIQLFLDI